MTPRLVVFPVLALGLLIGAGAIAQIGPPGRPQLATQGAPPPPPVVERAAATGFPASYDTTCLEDATDGEDDTPSSIAWVADDGGTSNTGSFDDPYDYNEQLLGINAASNANWIDLWGNGVRTVCWKKVPSNYTLIDGRSAATAWNQGPLLSTSPTQGMVNFGYPAAPLNAGSDAAFEATALISGNDRPIPEIDTNDSRARAAGEWYGFRFGERGTIERAGFWAWGSGVGTQDKTIRVEWNYFASSLESDYTARGSGNDSSVYFGVSDGATAKYNYFARVGVNPNRPSKSWAGVRSYNGVGMDVSNNTFAVCDPSTETNNGWDFVFPKRDNHDFTFARNEMYVLNGGASCNDHIGVSKFQGAGHDEDANVGLWERNLYWSQTTGTRFTAYTTNFGSDDQTYRYNLIYRARQGFQNGDTAEASCDRTNTDHRQNVNAKYDGNVFLDVGDYLVRWYSHINNQPRSIDDNAIWFVDDRLGSYVRESHRGGGTYIDCGGATTANVNANTPNAPAGIANLNGLSYASGNNDSDPRMVCQYTGDNKCNGGTPAAPDDIRFCTGVNTPVAGCPGASPHVDGSGIARIGPYQGENMNDDPSTYTVKIGATWLPPANHR